MKQFKATVVLSLILPLLFIVSGCKKTKLPQVYFSSSSATVPANGTATVTISLSEPSNNVIGVGFQSIGTSKIDFGTVAGSFMHDDSDKMMASIDANGFVDSTGHILITPGAKGVVVTFSQKSDAFPHAAANFEIKMTSAQNATIRQGSDTYTYNINSSNVSEQFTSVIVYTDTANNINGGYTLDSSSYVATGNTYTLTLKYLPEAGVIGPPNLTIVYSNLPPFTLGDDTINCSNASITVTGGPISLSCSNFIVANTIAQVMNTTTPGIYGNYYVFNTGTTPLNNLRLAAPNYLISGSLSSPFIYYTP